MSQQRNSHTFRIADFNIRITFEDNTCNSISLLPSFGVFATTEKDKPDDDVLFSLTVDDSLEPVRGCELIRKSDTGNGETYVYMLPNGGYKYIIKDLQQRSCCLLQTDREFRKCQCALRGDNVMRSFGLNSALMLIFAFAGAGHETLMMHASCVEYNGVAYPFTAKSGTGKSTHSQLWIKHIPGTELINDDNPIIRIIGNDVFLYGSPWSGKTPCYRNVRMRLGAVTKIKRAPANSIERLDPVKAFASLIPTCSTMKWDKTLYEKLCSIITKLVERIPVYTLYCLPDKQAAQLCHKTITAAYEQ